MAERRWRGKGSTPCTTAHGHTVLCFPRGCPGGRCCCPWARGAPRGTFSSAGQQGKAPAPIAEVLVLPMAAAARALQRLCLAGWPCRGHLAGGGDTGPWGLVARPPPCFPSARRHRGGSAGDSQREAPGSIQTTAGKQLQRDCSAASAFPGVLTASERGARAEGRQEHGAELQQPWGTPSSGTSSCWATRRGFSPASTT